jgi:hypothetical protein
VPSGCKANGANVFAFSSVFIKVAYRSGEPAHGRWRD